MQWAGVEALLKSMSTTSLVSWSDCVNGVTYWFNAWKKRSFKKEEKSSKNVNFKSKNDKCIGSSVPTSNKSKVITDFVSIPSAAHPPTNCKQCNSKFKKAGFRQSKAKPNRTKHPKKWKVQWK